MRMRGIANGWSSRLFEVIKANEGLTVNEILKAAHYQQKYEYGYNLIYQLAGRGAVVVRDQKYYLPTPSCERAVARSPTEWKPLVMAKAVFQRPTYSAPGCVIRGEPDGVPLA
jgi:hypothetical protein